MMTEMTNEERNFRDDATKRRDIFNACSKLYGDELDVVLLLVGKFIKGSEKYGTWIKDNDKRDYKEKALLELQDFVIYTLMNECKGDSK